MLVGALALVISSYFYGHHVAYVEQEAEIARLNMVERDKEQQMVQLSNIHAKELERANQNAKAQVNKLQSDIASGELRLSIRTVPACKDTSATTGGAETRAELDPEVANALIAIASDGDKAIRSLNACIDIYNEVRSKQ
jgi:hypothetical protein